MADEYPSLGESVGELRSDSRRNFEAVNSLATEMRRMSDKFEQISALGTQLTEYRLTLHDRFDRINEIAASTTLTVDKIDDRLAIVENDKYIALDKRISTIETTWKTQLKMIAVIGSIILTAGGWFIGTYGKDVLKALTGIGS